MDKMRCIKGNEILNITVDIGSGRQDRVIVHEFDDPNVLAREFALRHNLNQKLEMALTIKISDLLKDLAKDQTILSNSFSSRSEIENSTCSNYGEKMYLKGLKHKEQIEVNKQLLKMKIEKEISETTSFKPIINEKSRKIAKNSHTRSNVDVRLQTPQEDITEYTFTPKINEKSIKIVGNKANRINELYEEAKERKNRIENMNKEARENEFPFRPDIKSTGKHSNPEETVERLVNSKSNYYQSIEELRKKLEVTKDPETGQEFFKPNIGKTSQSQQNRENVWEFLYKFPKKPLETPTEYPYTPVKLESKARTEKILEDIKKERYSEIFQQLNPDETGQIFFNNIDMRNLDPIVLNLISPLLIELEQLGQPLSLKEFSDSMDNLIKILTPAEKSNLLIKYKKKNEESENSIKKSCSSNDVAKLYERHLERKNATSAKLDIEREKKKRLELEGCTFHPKTTKYPLHLFK